jgi:hypothetical protein
MADCRIIAIRKPDRYSDHEHITHVKIVDQIYTREFIIKCIEDKTDTFYVYDSIKKKRSDVAVRYPKDRDPYIQTHADNDWNDNLLSLPEC